MFSPHVNFSPSHDCISCSSQQVTLVVVNSLFGAAFRHTGKALNNTEAEIQRKGVIPGVTAITADLVTTN